MLESLEKLNDQVAVLRATLTDPDISSYRLVVNPEKMVIKEALRAETYLALYGYPIDGVLCNRVLPCRPGEYQDQLLREMVAQQRGYYEQIHQTFAPLPVWDVPYSSREILGVGALARLGDEIWGERRPHRSLLSRHSTAADEGGRPLHPAAAAAARGAGARSCMTKKGDELIVEIGNFKRDIMLPTVLARWRRRWRAWSMARWRSPSRSQRQSRAWRELARMSEKRRKRQRRQDRDVSSGRARCAGRRAAHRHGDERRPAFAFGACAARRPARRRLSLAGLSLILDRFAPEGVSSRWTGPASAHPISPAIRPRHSIQGYAEILAGWMDSLGIARAVFVGNSVGAGAAIQYATTHPQRALGLLLVAPAGFTPSGITRWTAARLLGTPGILRAVVGPFTSLYLGPTTDATKAVMDRQKERRAAPDYKTSIEAYAALWRSFDTPAADLSAVAREVAAPAMVVRGALDPIITEADARRAAEALGANTGKRALEVVLPNAGHLPFLQEPERFLKALEGLLATAEVNAAMAN